MTHSAQADTGPVRLRLAELSAALVRLDRSAVESGCAELEGLFLKMKQAQVRISPSDGAELRAGLARVQALLENAGRLYAGWARIAAFEGPAYTQIGVESALPVARSLAVDG